MKKLFLAYSVLFFASSSFAEAIKNKDIECVILENGQSSPVQVTNTLGFTDWAGVSDHKAGVTLLNEGPIGTQQQLHLNLNSQTAKIFSTDMANLLSLGTVSVNAPGMVSVSCNLKK